VYWSMRVQSGLLKVAARCFSATARPTALAIPWPRGPGTAKHTTTTVLNCIPPLQDTLLPCSRSEYEAPMKAGTHHILSGHSRCVGRRGGLIRSCQRKGRKNLETSRARTGGDLHSRGHEVLGMARAQAVPLPEGLDSLHLQGQRQSQRSAHALLNAQYAILRTQYILIILLFVTVPTSVRALPRCTAGATEAGAERQALCGSRLAVATRGYSRARSRSRRGGAGRTGACTRGRQTARSGSG